MSRHQARCAHQNIILRFLQRFPVFGILLNISVNRSFRDEKTQTGRHTIKIRKKQAKMVDKGHCQLAIRSTTRPNYRIELLRIIINAIVRNDPVINNYVNNSA